MNRIILPIMFLRAHRAILDLAMGPLTSIWWLVLFGPCFDRDTHQVGRSFHHRVRRVNRLDSIAWWASLMGQKLTAADAVVFYRLASR